MKRALLIGINYIGQSSELNGCINDVENVCDMLVTYFGYDPTNIRLLTDTSELKPTGQNILNQISWLLNDAKAGDHFYFHYSGHGSRLKDDSDDEADGYDEVIIPLDCDINGCIDDDLLRKLLVDSLQEGMHMTIVMDCCHSGTILDNRYNYDDHSERIGFDMNGYDSEEEMNNNEVALQELISRYYNKDYLYRDYIRKTTTTVDARYPCSQGSVICFSGCMDDQTSADAYIDGSYQGALTSTFVKVIENNKSDGITLANLLKSMRIMLLEENYTQIPQMSSGKSIDLGSKLDI